MITAILLGIDFLLSCIYVLTKIRRIHLTELIAVAGTVLIIIFASLSGILFLFDCFAIERTLVCQAIIFFVLILWKNNLKEDFFKITLSKEELIPIFVFICSLFVVFPQAELWSNAQDQGLYQAEALELIRGNYDIQHDFEEYSILKKTEDQIAYQEMVKSIIGFYSINQVKIYPTINESMIKSDVSGYYHGVQTFPAILALTGKILGMQNMLVIHIVMLGFVIVLIWFCLRNLNVNLIARTMGILLLAASPLILWLAKTSYTEMTLTLIVAIYLYWVSVEKQSWFCGVILSCFSFLHVSFLLIYPCFFLGHLILWFREKKADYIWANIIMSVGLALGNYTMAVISPPYYYGNISRLFLKNVITEYNWLYWLFAGCLLGVLISVIVFKYNLIVEKLMTKINMCKIGKATVRLLIICSTILVFIHILKIGYCSTPLNAPGSESLYQYYGTGLICFSHTSLWAFCMAVGFVVVPFVFYCLLKKPEKFWIDSKILLFQIIYLYMICFNVAFFRKEVPYYYYYARYLGFYVPIIIVMFAWIFSNTFAKINWAIFAVSLCLMLPFDIVLSQNRDDTLVSWETMLSMDDIIPEKSAIIFVDESIPVYFGPQLRAITDSHIFPRFENLNEELEMLLNYYNDIYLVSWKEISDFLLIENGKIKLKYSGVNKIWRSNKQTILANGLFPLKYDRANQPVYLYQYVK